ncbi:hypothetical protein BV898_05951 [Hypsibius exemplaris]|uniref:Gustatory receptor n=1 Tax=Hypsibius exemplaris TaxID=2072580 RepID=A0A1W0WXK8_HYPEX|nr:hypothetical protein BV898_05951 [Hypsibius exemplaris]
MADQVAVLQTGTLTLLGFLQKRRRPLSTLAEACGAWVRTTVAVAIVVGSMVCFGIDSAQAVKSMTDKTNYSFLVKVFIYSPYCLLDLRPVYVLVLLLYNRRKFEKLTTAANDFTPDLAFLAAPHSQASSWKFRMKFRTKSKLWFLLSGTLVLLWYSFFQGVNYTWWLQEYLKHRGNDTADTFWMANQLEPLPPFLPAWQNIILCCVCSIFPLILSQQVIGIFVLNADFLKEGLRDLNRDIREQIESFGPRRDAVHLKQALNLESQIRLWTRLVESSRAFCSELNDFFGTIVFGVYGVDFLVLVGFGTNLIYMPFEGLETSLFYVYAALMIVAFMTLFLIPLPLAYEESTYVSSNIQKLIDRICHSLTDGDQKGKKLLDRLTILEHSSRTYPCLFQSVGLMSFTRAFLTGTCTLALSLLILAKEFLSDKLTPEALLTLSINATGA